MRRISWTGGYYDNDGTAQVVKFLRYALARTPSAGQDVCEAWSKEEETKASSRKSILLIKVRNSGDDLGGEFDQWPNHTSAKNPAHLLTRLLPPPLGLWQPGRESVTGRNCLALTQLDGRWQTGLTFIGWCRRQPRHSGRAH
jgi:hypothetical protein